MSQSTNKIKDRRPTLDEMRSGCFVRGRGWDEMAKDGTVSKYQIWFKGSDICFHQDMKEFCGTTHKIIGNCLDGCGIWTFTRQMLTYVAPEVSK